MPSQAFSNELEELINRHSVENQSNTPDFILARYIENSLVAYNIAIHEREKWYGHENAPGQS